MSAAARAVVLAGFAFGHVVFAAGARADVAPVDAAPASCADLARRLESAPTVTPAVVGDLRLQACALTDATRTAVEASLAKGEDSRATVELREQWALLLFVNGESAAAHENLRLAVQRSLELDGPTSPEVARRLRTAAWLLQLDGRPADALPLLDRAMAIVLRDPAGATSAEADDLRARKAVALRELRRLEEALPLFEEVARWRETNAPSRAACPLREAATLVRASGETGKAHALEERARDLDR